MENEPSIISPSPEQKRQNRSLLLVLAIVVGVVAALAVIGFIVIRPPELLLEGQVEGTTVRISGKLPGRVAEIYVREGDTVHCGDTLIRIHSALFEAQLQQAQGVRTVAEATNRKVDAGTRRQIIQAAHDLWLQAQAAEGITQKTYQRLERLYQQGVMTEQKRDEARAAYDAARAATAAAKSQYDLAVAGAQTEDRQAAAAGVSIAGGAVSEVEAMLQDAYLTAPDDGTIDEIYPQVGELVMTGAPLMQLLKFNDRWVVFNVNETLLPRFKMGSQITMTIPGMDNQTVKGRVYYQRDMGSYATWRATKATGDWDTRTFEVKVRPDSTPADLRPGMSAIVK